MLNRKSTITVIWVLGIMLSSVLIVSATIESPESQASTTTPVWCDGFEGYTPGSSSLPSWSASGNTSGVLVDNTEAYTGNNSLKLYGHVGGCWGVLMMRPLEIGFPITIEAAVKNGTENLSGCHPYHASFGLKTGTHWSNSGINLWHFLNNGDLRLGHIYSGSERPVFTGYELDTWYDIRVELTVPGDDSIHAKYWVDGEYLGEFSKETSAWSFFDDLSYIDIGAQEGTVWFDDICVSTLEETQSVAFDIKPGSCPNPLNVKIPGPDWIWIGGSDDEYGDPEEFVNDSYGKPRPGLERVKKNVLPVAILGTADFDVNQVNLNTVMLLGVPPLRASLEDVATPVASDAVECECNDFGPDGLTDLTLKFGRAEIITALGAVFDGDMISLTISGQLLDGTEFEGVDCLLIRGDQPASMVITDLPITNTQLVGNAPNPFNPMTTISFNLANQGQVRLAVYNISGQRVKTLLNETFQAGLHNVVWDGRDESGNSAASGIYFYRLETADFTESKRMVLLK